MRNFQRLGLFVLLFVHLSLSKKFDKCELIQELILNQNLPINTAKIHFCIAALRSNLKTNAQFGNFYGLYKISKEWWCDSEGLNLCDIKCEKLLDDSITDDVKCAGTILRTHGLNGWVLETENCKDALDDLTCTFEEIFLKKYHSEESWQSTPTDIFNTPKISNLVRGQANGDPIKIKQVNTNSIYNLSFTRYFR